MPDIQKGRVEITKYEAKNLRDIENQYGSANIEERIMDEMRDEHDESAYTHLGRS